MRKPISTKVHGILDFMTAGLMFALPRAMGWSKDVTRLLDANAAGAVGYSLITKYEWGVARVLPMKGHLALDAVAGGALLGAAAFLDDEDPDVRLTLAGLGLFELSASLLTRTTAFERTPRRANENALPDQSHGREHAGDLSMPAARPAEATPGHLT